MHIVVNNYSLFYSLGFVGVNVIKKKGNNYRLSSTNIFRITVINAIVDLNIETL